MSYHIEHAPVEDACACSRQVTDYQSLPVVIEVARLLSHFDPYGVYTVNSSAGLTLHTFWNGKEKLPDEQFATITA